MARTIRTDLRRFLQQLPDFVRGSLDGAVVSDYCKSTEFSMLVKHMVSLYKKASTNINHKPLVGIMLKVSDRWIPRQQTQLSFISEFTTDSVY